MLVAWLVALEQLDSATANSALYLTAVRNGTLKCVKPTSMHSFHKVDMNWNSCSSKHMAGGVSVKCFRKRATTHDVR